MARSSVREAQNTAEAYPEFHRIFLQHVTILVFSNFHLMARMSGKGRIDVAVGDGNGGLQGGLEMVEGKSRMKISNSCQT